MGPPRIAAHADLIHEASVAFSTLNKGRERVLEQQLRDGWRVRERAVPVSPVMNFTSEGLVLGAGSPARNRQRPRAEKGARPGNPDSCLVRRGLRKGGVARSAGQYRARRESLARRR